VLDGKMGGAQTVPEEGAPMEVLTDEQRESGELKADLAAAVNDLEEGMSRVNATQQEDSELQKATVTFAGDKDAEMEEATEAEVDAQMHGVEADADQDEKMTEWDQDTLEPEIKNRVKEMWGKLPNKTKRKNTKSDWIRQNVQANKQVAMEEDRKTQMRVRAKERANKKSESGREGTRRRRRRAKQQPKKRRRSQRQTRSGEHSCGYWSTNSHGSGSTWQRRCVRWRWLSTAWRRC
jgi:hypothetical protein